MSNILKYYKNTFILMLKLGFAGGSETGGAYEAIKEASNSGDFLSPEEWNKLKNKYERKNPDAFKKALKQLSEEGAITSTLEVLDDIDRIIGEWNDGIQEVTQETQVGLSNERETYTEVVNPFNRTLKLGKRGADVRALQEFLNSQGYDTNGIDGQFGPGTKKALKKFQKEVLGYKKADGVMDLNGKTMNYIVENLGISSNDTIVSSNGDTIYGKEEAEVIGHLGDFDRYLTAFNEVYGGTEDVISRDNGILGIVNRLGGSSLDRLERELKPNYSNIDKQVLAEKLGIPENSKRFKEGLARTAIIAALSAIISGGATLALELFGINYGENLKNGPEMSKILDALGRGSVDMKKEVRDMLLADDTTVAGLNKVVDILNNPNMDTANLKRFMKEVYQPNWFQDTFGIFLPNGYEEIDNLVSVFEQTNSTEDAKAVVRAIYENAHMAYNNAKQYYLKAQAEYNKLPQDIIEKAKEPAAITNSYGDEETTNAVHDATFIVRRYKNLLAKLNKAEAGLGKLGTIASRYANLDAKRAQKQGERFDIEAARNDEKQIDAELGVSSDVLQKIDIKELHSEQSFNFKVDISRLQDTEYMENLLTKMGTETINGKTSILAGLIRGIRQHYNIDISIDEFKDAFLYTAEAANSDYILSNLGRDRNQRFQGDLGREGGNLFKIQVHGQDIYFKDSCTNIVTVANDLHTTIDYASSVPVVVTVNIGGHHGNSGKGGKDDSHTGTEGGGDNGGGGNGGGNDAGR